MLRTGRPKAELVLTDDERDRLQRWTRRYISAQALALRSRIILAAPKASPAVQLPKGWAATRPPSANGSGGLWPTDSKA